MPSCPNCGVGSNKPCRIIGPYDCWEWEVMDKSNDEHLIALALCSAASKNVYKFRRDKVTSILLFISFVLMSLGFVVLCFRTNLLLGIISLLYCIPSIGRAGEFAARRSEESYKYHSERCYTICENLREKIYLSDERKKLVREASEELERYTVGSGL